MSRRASILGRVRRNLVSQGILPSFASDKINDGWIYDEMQQAQDDIYSRVKIEHSFVITLVEDQTDYPLQISSDDVIDTIKEFILPTTYNYDLTYVKPDKWNNVIQSELSGIGQPTYYTIFEKTLKLQEAPTSTDAGDEWTLYVYLKRSLTDIDKDTDPEIDKMWDKGIEFYTTMQFLKGGPRRDFLNDYEDEIKNKGYMEHIHTGEQQHIEDNW